MVLHNRRMKTMHIQMQAKTKQLVKDTLLHVHQVENATVLGQSRRKGEVRKNHGRKVPEDVHEAGLEGGRQETVEQILSVEIAVADLATADGVPIVPSPLTENVQAHGIVAAAAHGIVAGAGHAIDGGAAHKIAAGADHGIVARAGHGTGAVADQETVNVAAQGTGDGVDLPADGVAGHPDGGSVSAGRGIEGQEVDDVAIAVDPDRPAVAGARLGAGVTSVAGQNLPAEDQRLVGSRRLPKGNRKRTSGMTIIIVNAGGLLHPALDHLPHPPVRTEADI